MSERFQLQGHRGARGLFPENTIEGVRSTLALGLRWLEIDVGVTRDDVVVVHHDVALHPDVTSMAGRWPGGSLPLIRKMSWEDLEDITVGRIRPGSDYAALWPEQVPVDGARIPRLVDMLATFPEAEFNIELKLVPDRRDWTVAPERMVELVLDAVDAAGAAERVVLQSFDWRAPRHVRRVRPAMRRGWLTSATTQAQPELWWDRAAGPLPELVAEEGGGTWTPYWETLEPAQVARAHALGVMVVPWTVNDEAAMQRLIGWGVDGLITDRPDLALPLVPG